ncbi:ribonuclease H1 [Apiospora kogelbergensis]|uniref:ribonuclease H n=1 Tax=Apiospora kogelbergensis TaxID=1337665 RepID=A0AAW0R842_9PEZI
MVYKLNFHVDGGCRRNGLGEGVIGGAAAIWNSRYRHIYRTRILPAYSPVEPPPTNQRAELLAIIMAQQWTLERYQQLRGYPRISVRIYSDSQYAVKCLNIWFAKWSHNGWLNARGLEVANRDLLEHALALHDDVEQLGSVRYIWIPRARNRLADRYCKQALDQQE